MKVFLPVSTEQNLRVMPRVNVATVDVSIRQKLTDTTTNFTDVSTSFSDGYLSIPLTHPFIEGETYEIQVTRSDNDGLLWRGIGYVTAQTPQNFKLYA